MPSEDKYNMRARELIESASEKEHWDALDKTGFWGKQAAGCIFLAMDTGQICLAHRSREVLEPNTWGTWGGAMDAGEDPKTAIKREVQEEAGYTGPLKLIPLMVFNHASGFRYSNFLAVVKSEFKPVFDWETQGSGWFEFGKWPKPLHPGLTGLLNDPSSVNTIKKYLPSAQTPSLVTEGPAEWGLPEPGIADIKNIDKNVSIKKPLAAHQNAIDTYTGSSKDINSTLHRHYRDRVRAKIPSYHQPRIEALDALIRNNKLKIDLDVYTGLPESPAVAWHKYKQDTTQPIRLHLPAYTSTSPSFTVAKSFARDYKKIPYIPSSRNDQPVPKRAKHMLLIHLQKGMNAAGVEKYTDVSAEHEVILPRGLEIMVDPRPTTIPKATKWDYTIIVWHAEVVGHQPVQIT